MTESNYYAILPAAVRYDKNLTANAKLLYAEITSLTYKTGYCYASNEYFAGIYETSQRSIQIWMQQLEEAGYINREILYKSGTKEVLERRIKVFNLVNKDSPPHEEIFTTPHEEIFVYNNKYLNNKLKDSPYSPPRDSVSCIDYDSFMERWNRSASRHDNMIAINLMNEGRKKKLEARFKDMKKNGKEPTIENFFKIIGTAYQNSEFLQGEKTGFNFTLDFVLQAKSFQKILENGYRDK